MISTIVCADKNWGIGYQGDLLTKIPDDTAMFKQLTEGSTVVMGRKTYDSLPNRPLSNRENIVITDKVPINEVFYEDSNGTAFTNLGEIKTILANIKNHNFKYNNIFIIGGGQIYKELLPYCEKAYVTEIDHGFENVDTYFPNLDEMPNWWLIESSKLKEYNGLTYRFNVYKQVNYEIIDIFSNYFDNTEEILIHFKNSDVVHKVKIKYLLNDSENVKLQSYTIPALCCKRNFEKFMTTVQQFKQNRIQYLTKENLVW